MLIVEDLFQNAQRPGRVTGSKAAGSDRVESRVKNPDPVPSLLCSLLLMVHVNVSSIIGATTTNDRQTPV